MSKSVVRRVGIIGLGKMGHPMARHLRKAGFDVSGYDIDARARSAAQPSGIAIAANPGAVAEQSDFVIVVVGFDKEAETVLLGADGIASNARRGLIVGIASTWRRVPCTGSPRVSPTAASSCSTCRSPAASPRPKRASFW
jgi:3-hydroxyisobutyrate dehydrogenase-like beta-hydroxyacid dehydrogenase